MSDAPPPRLRLTQGTDLRARGQLLARVQTVHLLKMSEPQIADLIREIEADPLFENLLRPGRKDWKILRFQAHPRTSLSSSFYEVNEQTMPSNAPADLGGLFDAQKEILEIVQRMGREAFETHFLRAEEDLSVDALAERLGISPDHVRRVQDFLLAYSVRSEFFDPSTHPGTDPSLQRRVNRLARLAVDPEGEVHFELTSPHLARGRYDIHYDRLKSLTEGDELPPEQKRRLKAFIRRLELVNWRQNTLFRIVDLLCHGQRGFLSDRDALRRSPITQRQMSRKLAVAPSTVNRAIQDRSLVLPWGEEALLEDLFCSRKDLCVEAMEVLEEENPDFSKMADWELQEKMYKLVGVKVPRRTLNTYRRLAETRAKSAEEERPETEK